MFEKIVSFQKSLLTEHELCEVKTFFSNHWSRILIECMKNISNNSNINLLNFKIKSRNSIGQEKRNLDLDALIIFLL